MDITEEIKRFAEKHKIQEDGVRSFADRIVKRCMERIVSRVVQDEIFYQMVEGHQPVELVYSEEQGIIEEIWHGNR